MWSLRRPDGTVPPGWYLTPLRLFLGITFLFAGLQKLSNPAFFRASSPISIHAQMVGAAASSPIHGLVHHLVSVSTPIGVIIALGEVAIGIGVLIGLWVRVAAGTGMVLSFSLFLTVSFHASPYYTGSDIVFLFAWTPLVLAGAGGAPALDTWLDRPTATAATVVPNIPRRQVISKGAATGLAAIATLALSGLAAATGRAVRGADENDASTEPTLGAASPTTTSSPGSASTETTETTPSGRSVGPASEVPVGGAAAFTDPGSGDPALVIQAVAHQFVAFDAVCPHAGCTVGYQASADIIACPCHGSEFDPRTGSVIRGPATRGLSPIPITEGPSGELYVSQ